jgi:pyruvate ferredoxin oxidoreductase gamma subunit
MSRGSFEVRIHGRGGQGVVTTAELLAAAAFTEGRYAQAFPSFGSERTGAPVVSFCRISEAPIRRHEPIAAPNALMIIDPTLVHQVDVFAGLGEDAYVLINSSRSLHALQLEDLLARCRPERLRTVAATELARQELGRPLPNAALLGGFAAASGVVSIDSVLTAIRQRFEGEVGEGNARAATRAFELVAAAAPESAPAAAASPGAHHA